MRLARDGRLIPLMSCGSLRNGDDSVRVLRLNDGLNGIGYAIAEVVDIVEMDTDCERALVPGLVAGGRLVTVGFIASRPPLFISLGFYRHVVSGLAAGGIKG